MREYSNKKKYLKENKKIVEIYLKNKIKIAFFALRFKESSKYLRKN